MENAMRLFAEMQHDYAAAKVRDEKGEAAVVPGLFTAPEPEPSAAELIAKMTPEERTEGFRALLGSGMGNSHHLEDADGEYRLWRDLSPAGKVRVISDYAAHYDVPFEAFAATAKEHIGTDSLLDASLRVLYNHERELTAIGRELPGDDRIEPIPLVDQVKYLVADLRHAEGFIRRQQELER